MRVLFSEDEVQARVRAMASEIAQALGPGPPEVLMVGPLRGAVVLMADLARALHGAGVPVVMDFLKLSSYGAGTESSGVVRMDHDLELDVSGQHVLLVDDIIDTGRTLRFAADLIQSREPASLRIAAFLDKPARRVVHVDVDHVGFQIPDHFVVGYGTDLNQRYRELPYVGVYSGG